MVFIVRDIECEERGVEFDDEGETLLSMTGQAIGGFSVRYLLHIWRNQDHEAHKHKPSNSGNVNLTSCKGLVHRIMRSDNLPLLLQTLCYSISFTKNRVEH